MIAGTGGYKSSICQLLLLSHMRNHISSAQRFETAQSHTPAFILNKYLTSYTFQLAVIQRGLCIGRAGRKKLQGAVRIDARMGRVIHSGSEEL